MSNTPENLLFSGSHEWVRREADGTATIGISVHAQQALGDLVYLKLPDTPYGHALNYLLNLNTETNFTLFIYIERIIKLLVSDDTTE